MERLILKLGGSVVTVKSAPLTPKTEAIDRAAEEISMALERGGFSLAIVHGGGSYGHYVAEKILRERGRIGARGFSEIVMAMRELNMIVARALVRRGVPAVPFDSHAIYMKGRDLEAALDPVDEALERGMIPLLYGDVIFSRGGEPAILSGDVIAWRLCLHLRCSRALFATSVEGVFDKDPSKPGARLLRELRVSREAVDLGSSSSGFDVTGGMRTKILEGIEALKAGARGLIFNGEVPGNIYKALLGFESLGTVVIY